MATTIDWEPTFRRSNFEPLDLSYVFNTVADLEEYLSSAAVMEGRFGDIKGYPYPGQIAAVLNSNNAPDVYVIWEVLSGTPGAVENELNNLFYAYEKFEAGAAAGTDDGTW
jgi:hypothetical protein